jgi:hypothetical protein
MPISTTCLGASLPEYPDKRWYKVIAPQGKLPCKVTLLANCFTGFWTHWIKDHSNPKGKVVPCAGQVDCPMCRAGYGIRWTGYSAAYSWQYKEPRVVAITEAAGRQLIAVYQRYGSLRGQTITLQRKDAWLNAPVVVTFHGHEKADLVPAEFDIMPSLNRMWGATGAGRTPSYRQTPWQA